MADGADLAEFKVCGPTDVRDVLVKCHVRGDNEAEVSSRRREGDVSVAYLDRGGLRGWKLSGLSHAQKGFSLFIIKFKFVFYHPCLNI